MYKPGQRGDTLVEVTIGLAILAMVLAGTISLASYAFRVNNTARERTQAVNYVQEQAEGLRNYRDSQKWAQFTAGINAQTTADPGGRIHMVSSGGWQPVAGRVNSAAVPAIFRDTASSRGIYIQVVTRAANAYTFALTAQWERAGGGIDNKTTVYTRLVNTNP